MVFWLFEFIVTIMIASNSTLAQRLAAQTNRGLFCGKLLNYSRDDFDKIVADINATTNDYSLVPMSVTSHMTYGSKQFTLLGIKAGDEETEFDEKIAALELN